MNFMFSGQLIKLVSGKFFNQSSLDRGFTVIIILNIFEYISLIKI